MVWAKLRLSMSYNPGQKCWEGSVTFEIAPLWGRGGGGGGGHKSMLFPK